MAATLPSRILNSRPALLLAFAFAVMGDPVSSVAYAVEAALRALHGRLDLLIPTMSLVIAIIGLVIVNYHRLVARFPGGGDAEASGVAFGEGWAFLPLGALIVDYALTIAISVAAAASAVIAYVPALHAWRVPLALSLLVAVAGLTWFGHVGRALFALMTLSFVGVGSTVAVIGFLAPAAQGHAALHPSGGSGYAPLAVLLAFPVAMALATGVEAPSSAVAQLGQLDRAGKIHFGQVTLWLTLAIVAWLTLSLTVLAVRLRVGIPPQDSTQIAEVARAAVGPGIMFAAFQLTSAVLLLAAASSSYQAGPGLLKALARGGPGVGVLPGPLGRSNTHHTPYWGVALFLGVSALVVTAAGGREQELVLFYAVAVFVSFLFGLLSMAEFSRREGRRLFLVVNVVSLLAVAVTLAINLERGYPVASLGAACGIALGLHALWVRAGRPRGVSGAERVAEQEVAAPT
ncbi:MAG: amino acid permease [Gaiellales bacterium]